MDILTFGSWLIKRAGVGGAKKSDRHHSKSNQPAAAARPVDFFPPVVDGEESLYNASVGEAALFMTTPDVKTVLERSRAMLLADQANRGVSSKGGSRRARTPELAFAEARSAITASHLARNTTTLSTLGLPGIPCQVPDYGTATLPTWPALPPWLTSSLPRLKLRARIVDYWSAGNRTSRDMGDYLRDLGFEVVKERVPQARERLESFADLLGVHLSRAEVRHHSLGLETGTLGSK